MKAVVIAGGEGVRMRPLTCDVPKPLLRICGKPNIEYVLDTLHAAGCDEVVVTLCYLSKEIQDYIDKIASSKYPGMTLRCVEESQPRGTAGSVKDAGLGFSEPFLVIGGDTVCDFDLNRFRELHSESNNDLSILVTHVRDPREYGLVSLNKLGKVSAFIDTPGWSKAVSDLANTGIYFVNPTVMSFVPDTGTFDFAKDLFPRLMKEKKIIGGFNLAGYLCNICDLSSYLKVQYDIMLKKVKTNVNISDSFVCTEDGKIPGGRYKIVPPVYIGSDVVIGDGSLIGPGTVVDKGCSIGANVHLKGSVALPGSRIESGARITGAVLAACSTVKSGAELYDGCVLGSNSVVGNNSTVLQNVLIWPVKLIPSRVRVYENVVLQAPERDIFDDGFISGSADSELMPESLARIGKACASLKQGIKIGVATDGTRIAKVLKMALQSGAMAGGAHIWDFGDAFMAQMPFFASFCGLDIGIYIKGEGESQGNNARITFCDSDGLPLPLEKERDIESRVLKSNFVRSEINKGRDISGISSLRMIYSQELCRVAKGSLSGVGVSVESENPEISSLLREALDKIDCTYSDALSVKINADGTELSMRENGYTETPGATLLAICALYEFKDGKDIALPANAPQIIDEIAKMYSRKVHRYSDFDGGTSANSVEENHARHLAACQNWSKDALFMTVKILGIMRDTGKPLHELVSELPNFYVTGREMVINFSPSRLSEIFKNDLQNTAFATDGITLVCGDAKAFLTPSKKGNRLRILVEADNMEVAEEFGSKVVGKIAAEITETSNKRASNS